MAVKGTVTRNENTFFLSKKDLKYDSYINIKEINIDRILYI